MSVDLTKGATVELVKTLSDDLRTRDDNTKYSSAGAAMRDKANVDGYYEGLTSGTTEQIASSIYEEDNTPYIFRTAGGSIDIGDREEDTIVGGTVAWNQLVKNGNFESDTLWNNESNVTHTISNGVITINSGTNNNGVRQNGFVCKNGHAYLLIAEARCDSPVKIAIGTSTNFGVITEKDIGNTWTAISSVRKSILSSDSTVIYIFGRGTTLTDAQVRNYCIFDLTQMFGATIADYIYGLETATAGAGVAYFKKLFPKPYYAYDAGSLKSVEGLSAHKMTGFNQWDGETESGYIYNGTVYASNDYWRTKNYIKVVPNTAYYFKVGSGGQINCYDANKTYISAIGDWGGNSHVAVMPSNCQYIKFYQSASVDSSTVCVNLHWDGERDGEYEPYEEHVYDLDSSLTLRGLPRMDENNNLYYDGDVYKADGTVERKYGVVDLGTLTWVSDTTNNTFYTGQVPNIAVKAYSSTVKPSIVCAKYTVKNPSYNSGYATEDKVIWQRVELTNVIVRDSAYSDAATFKTAMSGVYLVYELATPTTETAQPYAQNQTVNDFGTEEYVSATNMIPVGHETKYQANLKAKLEMSPDSPADNGDYVVRHTDGQNAYVSLAPILAEKANTSGTYDDIVSGGTKQIISTIYEEDSEPYLFRTSGGSIDIGDREEDTIVGGTIAFNQLCPIPTNNQSGTKTNGSVVTDNRDGTYVVTASAPLTGVDYVWIRNKSTIPTYIKSNHVYLQMSNSSSTGIGGTQFVLYGTTNIAYIEENQRIFKPESVDSYSEYAFVLYFKTGSQLNNVKMSPCLFDLTQMFGSTIADYVLALEQSTAGAGVAWFKKLFNKPLYPYNEGELLSVEGLQSHDTVGFNALDVDRTLGTLTSGQSNTSVRSDFDSTKYYVGLTANNYYQPTYATVTINGNNITITNDHSTYGIAYPIRVLPNTVYCLHYSVVSGTANSRIGCYTENGTYIEYKNVAANDLFTTPKDCSIVTISIYPATYNATVTVTDINLNLSWDGERDGEYEPYVKHSYPLDDSLTLRGIPKLDSNNKLYYDGDIYEADGTVERRYGIVNLGAQNWTLNQHATLGNYFHCPTYPFGVKYAGAFSSTKYPSVCSKYVVASRNVTNFVDKTYCFDGSTDNVVQLQIKDSAYSDAASFKTAMSGVYLVYELATPTTEEAEPYQTPQIVDDFGTEEYVTDSIVPVGHETKYQPNLRAKLEMSPDSPSDNGDYIVRHTNGQNEYVPLVIPTELPAMPTDNGTYKLKVTVSNGTATLSWESE